jgi:hypothetical protein
MVSHHDEDDDVTKREREKDKIETTTRKQHVYA